MFCTAIRGSLISLVLMLCSRFCVRTSWLRCWNCTAGCSTAFTFMMMMDAKLTPPRASLRRPNGRPSPSSFVRRALLHVDCCTFLPFSSLWPLGYYGFESSGALVAPCGTGHTIFDLCRYKSTHVYFKIRLGIDEMKVTSLVDKESRKRSSILREKKKKRTTGKGCTGSAAL